MAADEEPVNQAAEVMKWLANDALSSTLAGNEEIIDSGLSIFLLVAPQLTTHRPLRPSSAAHHSLFLIYVSRWRNIQEAMGSVTRAIAASGQRSGISWSNPAPSRYTRWAMSMPYRSGLIAVKR